MLPRQAGGPGVKFERLRGTTMKLSFRPSLGQLLLALATLAVAAASATDTGTGTGTSTSNSSGTVRFQGQIADPTTAEGAALLQRQSLLDQGARVRQGLLPPRDSDAVFAALERAGQRQGTGAIDNSSFRLPVLNGSKSFDGYPQFQLRCDLQAGACRNTQGQVVGTLAEVADMLPPVRNRDALRRDWHCEQVCLDATGTVVGAMQAELRSWLAQHPEARLR